MIRFTFRALAVMFLALMVIIAVVDATRSIGASALMLTSFGASWDSIAPGTRQSLAQWLAETVHPYLSTPVLATIASWPTLAVCAGLAAIFLFLSRERRKKYQGLTGR